MANYINAGDAKAWKLCKRRVWYDHNLPEDVAPEEDAFESLIQQAGEDHEKRVLQQLSELGEVVEAESIEHTQSLIHKHAPVIYQPVARDGRRYLFGKPDFLVLTDTGEYQIIDAKLAASLKSRPDLVIQLGLYRWLFNTSLPALAYLGGGEIEEVGEEADIRCQAFIDDMREILQRSGPPDALFAYSKCGGCPYQEICVPQFEAQDDLSLLYGLDPRAVPGLKEQGIKSAGELADSQAERLQDVPYLKGAKKQRAIWQAQCYRSGQMKVIEEIKLPVGTWVHFDVETNPLSELGNEVYLWGLLPPPYSSVAFEYLWSDGGEDQDYQTWLQFLELIECYRQKYPNLILAHFANFEVTQIKTYAKRYQMESDERVQWLLGESSPLFDLREVVRKSLVLPLRSYGLKAICKSPKLVNFQWELEESGSQWSVVRYIDYLNEPSEPERQIIKEEILSYNRDDVKATRAMECWLREL